MKRKDVLALAQRGHPRAIAALLNQQLKYRGMRCQVNLVNHVLHVVLWALPDHPETPDRSAALEFFRAKIINLEIENLARVRLYALAPETHPTAAETGSHTGAEMGAETFMIPERPAWTQEFALVVGEYSMISASPSLAAAAPASRASSAPMPAPPPRSRRQPTIASFVIVAIALGFIVVSGYKLIARNSRPAEPESPSTPSPPPPIEAPKL